MIRIPIARCKYPRIPSSDESPKTHLRAGASRASFDIDWPVAGADNAQQIKGKLSAAGFVHKTKSRELDLRA